jgi:hypothetical protein
MPTKINMNRKLLISAASDAMMSQLDLFSSLVALVGSDKLGPGSEELLEVFYG